MKKSLFKVIITILLTGGVLTLTACDFFLNGEELKKELDQQIAYTNAPSVSVYLKADAELGEFLSDGEKSFKVGYDTEVQFTVNQESYVFEKLEAVVRNSPETSRSESVQFTEVESDAKKGIYKINVKVLKQVSDIMIRPVCTLLPKISSISPALEANGCNQDSAITISFNKNMNPESFKNSNGKITGLSITNGDDEDLSAYFGEPHFASDNKTLVILTLCYADNPKFLLPPDESKSSLNIKVNYTFVDVKDEDGLSFTENGTHNYKINKNFNEQEEVTVLVQNPDSSYGSFLSAGEKSCIVGFGFEIEFTLNTESYIFECFEAVSKNDGESRADCVAYENEQYDEENGVCRAKVRVLKAASDILIRPKCTLIENAEVTITQSEKGTKTISPADGTKVQSFLDRWYSVSFSPDEEYYEFIRWKLYDINTDEEIPNGTYVKVDDPTQPSTSYEVTKVPDTGIELALRPVVAERPQIISNTPQNSGILKDSSIQVLFDRDMDENSIYYSDDELESLIAKVGEKNLLSSDKREGKYYGYIKDGLTYYKNISLTNKKTGENLNDKFKEPVFEDKSTLTIAASKEKGKIIDDYTQVLVTLEKDFFYSEKIDETTSKPVTLRGITKWSYQVTNHGDEDALVFQKKNGNDLFTLKLESTDSDKLADETAHPTIKEDGTGISDLNFLKINNESKKTTLYCDMALTDNNGSGPDSSFTINYQRIKESDYTTDGTGEKVTGSFTYNYNTTTSQDAVYTGDLDLDLPADGIYRIWFDFADRSNNHFYYPANANAENSKVGFYVVKDEGINMKPPSVTDTSVKENISLKLTWEPSVDWISTKIRYKKNTETDWSEYEEFNTRTTKNRLYSNLDLSNYYDFEIINTDYLGNSQTVKFTKQASDLILTIDGEPEKTVYLIGDEFDNTGLTMTASLLSGVWWDVSDCHDFSSSEICWQGKTVKVNYSLDGVEKTATINAKYYVAAADALTQSPVKLKDYTGTLSGGVYYKFGDFPQTIASSQEDSDYSSEPVYNGWYLGSDGYFYDKCTENASYSGYTYSNSTTVAQSSANSEKYFRVEPIVWRALTTDYNSTGKALLVAEKELTANVSYYGTASDRTLNETTIYANNYKYSNIRAYLNGKANQFVTDGGTATSYDIDWTGKGFIDVAFTSTAKDLIATTTVDNSAESTTDAGNNLTQARTYACDKTEDKIFLLSEKEATTEDYGFTAYDVDGTGNSRIRLTTDYAKANYGYQNTTSGYGVWWWLRSPRYDRRDFAFSISYDGDAQYIRNVFDKYPGVVPALCVAPEALE